MSLELSEAHVDRHRLSDIVDDPETIAASVVREVHPKDGMFSGNARHYDWCGRDAIKKICGLLAMTGTNVPASVLDLACGYGRVARWLRAAFPTSRLVVSDVNKTAVEFCASRFEADLHLSKGTFAADELPQKFDLIWSGSLMTHLDSGRASEMLAFMSQLLNENGLAVFTTHGRYVAGRIDDGKWPYNLTEEAFRKIVVAYDNGDYGYTDYANMQDYGISLTPPPWIFDRLSKDPSIRLVAYMERGWAEHQDLVAFEKRPI